MQTSFVILDAMGVVFFQEDDLKVFMPYLEEYATDFGQSGKKHLIESAYLRLTKGEISSDRFFQSLNIDKPDLNFLLAVTLDPEFAEFAQTIRRTNILTILSNDSQEWSNYRNRELGLESMVDHYATSSLLGIRKPSRIALEKTCWLMNAQPENCIYVDNLAANLYPADELRMRVILFRRDGKNDSPYPLVRNLPELGQIISGGKLS
ncbi:MAG: HAD family hydrolase [Patescibacteria group bacterium]